MSDQPSVRKFIQQEAIQFDGAVSEAVAQDIGGTVNYLLDERDNKETRVAALEANPVSNVSYETFSFDGILVVPGQTLTTLYTTPNLKQIYAYHFSYLTLGVATTSDHLIFEKPAASTSFAGGSNRNWPVFDGTSGSVPKYHNPAFWAFPGQSFELNRNSNGQSIAGVPSPVTLWSINGTNNRSISVALLNATNPDDLYLDLKINVLYED